MADGRARVTRRAVGGEENAMARRVRSAGARGGFKARLRRQEAHGAWLARQQAGDARRTRVRRFLKRSVTVARIQSTRIA